VSTGVVAAAGAALGAGAPNSGGLPW